MRDTLTTQASGGSFGRLMLVLVLLAVIISTVMMTQSHASKRHGAEFVASVASQCNENNYTYHFRRESDHRDAYLCFLEEFGYVFTIKNFDPARIEEFGDDLVTAFDRKAAKSFQDAIDYITCTKGGVPVVPCGVKGGSYSLVP